MRILLMSLYFAPDLSAANAVIVSELAAERHRVTVVTSFPHYAGNTVDAAYRGRLIQRDEHKGARVIRTYVYASPHNQRLLMRVLNYLSFNVLSILAAIFAGPQDVIVAPSPPLTIGISAFIVSRFKRIPYVYNVQDIYPDVAIKQGALGNKQVIAFSYSLERFVYRYTRHVTVLSDGFRANLLRKGVPPDKMTVIPNFVDTEFVRPLPRQNGFRERLAIGDRFLVIYAGNIGHLQNLEHVLDCTARLRHLDDVAFAMVGNGSRRPQLERRAREMRLDNVHLIPFQPREEIPNIYAAADVSLMTLREEHCSRLGAVEGLHDYGER